MKITCICPTFGRAPNYTHLLHECVYWFTRQTYKNAELLILNDCPVQTLFTDVPRVRIINTATRYKTLGEKYNAMLDLADGELIAPWEDDDISLPQRLARSALKFSNLDVGYFNPQRSWYEQHGELVHTHSHGVCHNASMYRRDYMKSLGGYVAESGAQDASADFKLKTGTMAVAVPVEKIDEWDYVYRWGVSNIHLSAYADTQGVYTTHTASPAMVKIEARMGKDYHTMTNGVINALRSASTN